MSQRSPRYRYSWKKPWAFNSYHEMRRTITEREVYKKLKILERHSAFKKPYYNYKSHPHGELRYSGPGWPIPNPNPGAGPVYPPEWPQYGGCSMACLGGMLDCDGSCDRITCICGKPPFTLVIVEDPTGKAETTDGYWPMVCIPKLYTDAKGMVIKLEVYDSIGQHYPTEHPVIDCHDCCSGLEISGNSTSNPGTSYTFTIAPCCPDITVTVESNSGCDALDAEVDGQGCNGSFNIPDTYCGSLIITATLDKDGCDVVTASLDVRINDTGQGGDLVYITKTECGVGSWPATPWEECCPEGEACGSASKDDCNVGRYHYSGYDDVTGFNWRDCGILGGGGPCEGGPTVNPCTGESTGASNHYATWEWKCTCN